MVGVAVMIYMWNSSGATWS